MHNVKVVRWKNGFRFEHGKIKLSDRLGSGYSGDLTAGGLSSNT